MALAIWQPSFAEVVLVAIIGLCLMVWNVALLGGKNWARQLFVVGLPLVFGIGMLEEGFFRVVCLFLAGIYVCLVPALLGSASTSYFGGPVWRRRNNGAGERGQSP